MTPFWHVWLTGFFMGAADVVPGVSGGTVALLSGHYSRLIRAIRGIGPAAIGEVARGKLRDASARIDLGFLLTLATGLACGFALSLMTLKRLLADDSTRPATLATFAGLIVASAWILAASLKPEGTSERRRSLLATLLGIAVAAWIATLPEASAAAVPSLPFVFLCGAIGICAMILPGISGAMILMMIGVYEYLTGMPELLLKGGFGEALPVIATFAAGCALGLISFSRLLHWLLETHRLTTTSMLVGLMIGSILRLWPFHEPQTDSHRSAAWTWPAAGEVSTWITVAAFVLGAAAILLLHRWAVPLASRKNSDAEAEEVV